MLSFTFAGLAIVPLLVAIIGRLLGADMADFPQCRYFESISWGILAIWAELRRDKR